MHNNAKILFLGTPKIAAEVLDFLVTQGFNVIGAVSQVDRETDRKGRLLPTEVKTVCLKHNLPIYQYEKIRDHIDEIKEINPDVILTLAYGQIVPQAILDIPKLGCINLHGSILPKYRGAAPMQRALFDGEKETGFTLMQMVKAMDAGLMYHKEYIKIDEDDNYTSLYLKMIQCAKDTVLNSLDAYLNGELPGEQQNEAEVTFANKINKEDEILSLSLTCEHFVNTVRCLSYIPGGYFYLDSIKFKVLKAHKINNNNSEEVGKILEAKKNNFVFQLCDGQICIDELQIPGKKVMKTSDFLNGYKDILVGKYFKNEL